MKIAITMRGVDAPNYAERRDALAQDWVRLAARLGFMPVPVPNTLADPQAFVRELALDGVILSGGNSAPKGRGGESDAPERDATEIALVEGALAGRYPLFGVCRGLSLLNVACGGSVTHRFAEAGGGWSQHVAAMHPVRLDAPSWAEAAGGNGLTVNSFHDDAVLSGQVGDGLTVCATADDGRVVEGLAHPDLPIAAVQWHPERPNPEAAAFDAHLIARLFRDKRPCI